MVGFGAAMDCSVNSMLICIIHALLRVCNGCVLRSEGMSAKPKKTGRTPSGVRWRTVRRTVEVREHECLSCGKWFEVKQPDKEPKTCSLNCRVKLSRQRKKM